MTGRRQRRSVRSGNGEDLQTADDHSGRNRGKAYRSSRSAEFDPNFHNAVMHVEDEEASVRILLPKNFRRATHTVIQCVRHSMVKVAN